MTGKMEMSGLYSRLTMAGGNALAWRVRCSLNGALSACLLVVACFAFPAVASAGETCSNEARRAEQASTLPDCRAYEMVTETGKDSGEPYYKEAGFNPPGLEGIAGARASVGGDGMTWVSEYSLPGSRTPGLQYLSRRGAGGWSSENVIPPQSPQNGLLCDHLVGMSAWSPDLSRSVLADGLAQEPTSGALFDGENLDCGHDEPRLVAGEPEGFQNLFVHDGEAGSYQLVNVTPSSAPPPVPTRYRKDQFAAFLGGSSDLGHVVFEEGRNLTPEAPGGEDELYEWTGGVVRLVSVLPDGTAAANGTLGGAIGNHIEGDFVAPLNVVNFRHAVSTDGSRIFFQANGNLYLRENGTSTVQVDAPHGAGAGGGGEFEAASADGSVVFFADDASAGLTGDTVPDSGLNLYEYDRAGGVLTDLTPAGHAEVQGVSGASDDGSYVYFVADGVLSEQPNSVGDTATAGQPNLYVRHGASTLFVATLDPGLDSCDWALNTECGEEVSANDFKVSGLTARVPANGVFVGFNSVRSLTRYDNTDAHTGAPDKEIFLYDARANKLSCVSCDPSAAAPTGGAAIRYPALPSLSNAMRSAYPQRNVSEDGRVFFESPDALVPRDTNGARDVYEYEGGVLHLLSSGKSEVNSYFLDATPDGGDVFFATAQPLLARDVDAVYDIYDARVGGGFEEPVVPGAGCGGEGCRSGAVGAPVFAPPASAGFMGGGNLPAPVSTPPVVKRKSKSVRCRKGRHVRKRGRCVKAHRAKAKKSAKGRK
jgi:hypothetical protein